AGNLGPEGVGQVHEDLLAHGRFSIDSRKRSDFEAAPELGVDLRQHHREVRELLDVVTGEALHRVLRHRDARGQRQFRLAVR
ncbi:hypothetical protein NL526_29755, partial [Klebsiella pneumoniae]|nr:hypothetical protein [Klebsiella pneumoniae]